MLTVAQALQRAVRHHRAGQLAQAEQLYRAILQAEPAQVDALHLLGLIAYQVGQPEAALAYIGQALRLKPDFAEAHNNLGNVLKDQGRLDEAEASYQQALILKPDYVEAYNNLGVVFHARGKLAEALTHFQQALRLKLDFAEAHNNLGVVLQAQGQLAAALASYQQALRLKPDYAEASSNLGNVLKDQGQLASALASYQQALRLKPDYAEAHFNLGVVFQTQGQLAEALARYQQALRLQPDFVQAHANLGTVFKEQGKLDEAAACFEEALRLRPDYAEAYNNLGNVLTDQGRLHEAVASYRQALRLKPNFVGAHSNLVYTLYFCPGYDAAAIYEEHRRWNLQHAEPLAPFIRPHGNDRSPHRRLRIGYLSPDFRQHPVGRFLVPLLEAHDHAHFEIFCYASLNRPDPITERCRAQADVWRAVFGLSDEQLADAIRQDRIDILVDLTMHMANNRLLVFARKPAPVQVTYLAYAGTTGLGTMDYRLTDPYLDPPGQDESCYSEQSLRLPETYWCYRPLLALPPVNPLPALQAGHVTFGCLNNFCKVTAVTLGAWCRLLQALPQARLLLHAHAGSHRDHVRAFLARHGVAPERLTFVGRVPLGEYLRLYERLDVALDPFPYSGGTTTCDALWMGVPVVSLAGPTAVGRGGLSILSNVGLAELVAYDAEQYAQRAITLATDLARLSQLRASLRERLHSSPLLNAPRFARHLEAAYRRMWEQPIGGPVLSPPEPQDVLPHLPGPPEPII
jgi:predicted O-linked N-acetylglucosamine transferase (SPINDLY family)